MIVLTKPLSRTEEIALFRTKPVRALALDKACFSKRQDTLVICNGPRAGYYYGPIAEDMPGSDYLDSSNYNLYRMLLQGLIRDNKASNVTKWPSNWA